MWIASFNYEDMEWDGSRPSIALGEGGTTEDYHSEDRDKLVNTMMADIAQQCTWVRRADLQLMEIAPDSVYIIHDGDECPHCVIWNGEPNVATLID